MDPAIASLSNRLVHGPEVLSYPLEVNGDLWGRKPTQGGECLFMRCGTEAGRANRAVLTGSSPVNRREGRNC